jgi:glycosyltransferase involved in cell wall biosynthesis
VSLTVLSVAYPFAPVTADPLGGAEQVLAALDRALVAAGHRSVVIAADGSTAAGELLALPPLPPGEIDEETRAKVHGLLRARLAEATAQVRPDVIHLHGIDYPAYLPPPGGPPLVATLHLPLDWYPPEALASRREDLWLVPVSADQVGRGPGGPRLTAPVPNGVDLQRFRPAPRRGGYALAMGRICPEKGLHLALDAARAADLPLLLAGAAFPYRDHLRYLDEEIRPRLDRRRRWIGPVGGEAKARLLARARLVVAPSLVPETSSLVAREALASGAPVVAFRVGALADAVEDGRTGVLVEPGGDLAPALLAAARVDPAACRAAAEARFDLRITTEAYLAGYRRLAAGTAWDAASAAA